MVVLWQKAPDFQLQSSEGNIRLSDFSGKWVVLFFYVRDFSSVCGSELAEFNKQHENFRKMNAAVLGVGSEDIESHKKWAGELELQFPLASDTEKSVAKAYGVLNEKIGLNFRGTFIIDPEGTIKYIVVSDLGTGRSVKEILRVLKALQTGDLTPCEWQGGKTLGKPK